MSLTDFSSYPKTNPALLAALKQTGAEHPWEEFVATYHPMIQRWAKSANFNEVETMDLLGVIYLRLVPRMRAFVYNPSGRFRSWLARVVRTSIAEVHQKRSESVSCVTGSASVASLLSNFEQPSIDEEFASDFELRWKHARKIVRRVRKRFCTKTWSAFELSHIRDVNCQEVAEKLDMTIGSICVARSRVLAALRQDGQRDNEKNCLPVGE